jgi:ankyrin repeat protein
LPIICIFVLTTSVNCGPKDLPNSEDLNHAFVTAVLADDADRIELLTEENGQDLSEVYITDGVDIFPLLHFAVLSGSVNVVKRYRDNGGDIRILDSMNRMAGEIALRSGELDICKILNIEQSEANSESITKFFERRLQAEVYPKKDKRTETGARILLDWSEGVENYWEVELMYLSEDGVIEGKEAGTLVFKYGYFAYSVETNAIY